MEIKKVRYEGDKPVEIDGNKVLYHFTLNIKDYEKLTLSLAQELRVPFAFAICRHQETITGMLVYGRYAHKWYKINNYREYIIAHLVKKIR